MNSGPSRDFIGYGRQPPKVVWPLEARVAISLVVNYEEGSEYSHPDGDGRNELLGEWPHNFPEAQRDLRVESVHEYGSRAGIWRLIRLFAEYDVKVTFFATAVALERNLPLAQEITNLGHEVAGHGYRWLQHWTLSREEEWRYLQAAIESITRTCGARPRGWCCRNSSSVNTRELLVQEGGFQYDSDAYNDDLPYFVDVDGVQHLVVPYSVVENDIRYVTPQGFSSPSDFASTCKATLDYLWEEGATHPRMMSVGLHPRWSGQPARAHALREFLQHARGLDGVWFARRIDIAEHWWSHYASS